MIVRHRITLDPKNALVKMICSTYLLYRNLIKHCLFHSSILSPMIKTYEIAVYMYRYTEVVDIITSDLLRHLFFSLMSFCSSALTNRPGPRSIFLIDLTAMCDTYSPWLHADSRAVANCQEIVKPDYNHLLGGGTARASSYVSPYDPTESEPRGKSRISGYQ